MSDYTGHTPGPWFVHDLTGIGDPVSVSCTTPDHITVANMGPALTNTHEESLANARLIAAAPDLLAERDRLRGATQLFIDYFDDDNAWVENSDAVDYALDRLRAAFAEGGQDE